MAINRQAESKLANQLNKNSRQFSVGNIAANLLIPLLVLILMTGSKPDALFMVLNQIASTGFAVCVGLVVLTGFRHKFFWIIAGSAVLFRVGMGFDEGLRPAYLVFYVVMMFFAGVKLLRDHQDAVHKQIVYVVAATAILEILQIYGVSWAHVWSNLYHQIGAPSSEVLFVPADQAVVSGMQYRPVGFAHANNVLSQLLVLFAAYHFGRASIERRLNLWHEIPLAVACIFSGGKIVMFSLLVLAIIGFAINPPRFRSYVWKLIPLYAIVALLYFVLFPGLASYNYNLALFVFNTQGRIYDLNRFLQLPFLNELFEIIGSFSEGYYSDSGSRLLDPIEVIEGGGIDLERISGLALIAEYLPIVLPITLLALMAYMLRFKEFLKHSNAGASISLMCLIAFFVTPLGGPFLLTSYFWLFAGIAWIPLVRASSVIRPSVTTSSFSGRAQ